MSYYAGAGSGSGPPTLRAAIANVHRDSRWWAKCLGYGAAALTLVGLPLAAGFVMESLDNTRRGYPSPLPPWSDPALRWLTGLFCLLIDFGFFVLPLLIGGMIFVCITVALVIGANPGPYLSGAAPFVILGCVLASVAFMFGAGASPAGRLIFAREGKVEDAISSTTLSWALSPPRRGAFLRARLASLPAYLPAAALAGVTVAILSASFPAQGLALGACLWLTLAALIYAHLVVVQLYVAAEKEAERRSMGM